MKLDNNTNSVFLFAQCRWAPIETIRQYIESQGEKNKPGSKNKGLSK